jgi:hypothetical protein
MGQHLTSEKLLLEEDWQFWDLEVFSVLGLVFWLWSRLL